MMNKMLNGEPLKTKWGTSKIDNKGYYVISSRKEGNNKKLLHRLIAAEYFGEWINDPEDFFDIHHIDGNKQNNCVLNLEPIPHNEHMRLHNKGENNPMYSKTFSDEHRRKMSEGHNTTGYYRVYKRKDKRCKQGFNWSYQYYDEKGKRKSITGVDIEKLESKVKSKGLEWICLKEVCV